MRHDQLDRILAEPEQILPSAGFAKSVMEAVEREASTPPPIPFPWMRALPGIVAIGLTLAWFVFATGKLLRIAATAQQTPATMPILQAIPIDALGWVAMALLLTVASLALSWRLAYGRA